MITITDREVGLLLEIIDVYCEVGGLDAEQQALEDKLLENAHFKEPPA